MFGPFRREIAKFAVKLRSQHKSVSPSEQPNIPCIDHAVVVEVRVMGSGKTQLIQRNSGPRLTTGCGRHFLHARYRRRRVQAGDSDRALIERVTDCKEVELNRREVGCRHSERAQDSERRAGSPPPDEVSDWAQRGRCDYR